MEAGEGLLIGNLESGDTFEPRANTNTPQIKLIEFGAELTPTQQPPPTSAPTPYVDPFQQQSTSSNKPETDPFQVSFDPFGGLSSIQNSSKASDVGDLLGLGVQDKHTTSTPPQSQPTSSLGKESPSHPAMTGNAAGDIFDPFGSLGGNEESKETSVAAGSGGSVNLLGDSLLMPTSSPIPPSDPTHEHDDFVKPLLHPNPSPQPFGAPDGRKMSTPAGLGPQQHPITANKLSSSFSGGVSLSHPNLASFGAHPSASYSSSGHRYSSGGGWSSGMKVGLGGSVSHNTSPRRTPSPIPQSSSTGNIAQPAGFDPFQQFNLKEISGGMNGAKPPPATTASTANTTSTTTTTRHSKPPTGNNYKPYYMQTQANGATQPHTTSQSRPNSGRQASTGLGPKPKPASAFQTTSQAPNYNPSLFSVGSKTGV